MKRASSEIISKRYVESLFSALAFKRQSATRLPSALLLTRMAMSFNEIFLYWSSFKVCGSSSVARFFQSIFSPSSVSVSKNITFTWPFFSLFLGDICWYISRYAFPIFSAYSESMCTLAGVSAISFCKDSWSKNDAFLKNELLNCMTFIQLRQFVPNTWSFSSSGFLNWLPSSSFSSFQSEFLHR